MTEVLFNGPQTHKLYTDGALYVASQQGEAFSVRAWEFNGWRPESMSWKTSAYIHGPAANGPVVFKGPQAGEYLQSLTINSFANFPIGTIKHGVMCTEEGLIAGHAVIQRVAEDEFHWYRGSPWPADQAKNSKLDFEVSKRNDYAFQVAGPNSLRILEEVTGEDLRDIGFLHFRDSQINGTKVEIARIGMTGNLAYEIHGPMEDAPAVYDFVYQAGLAHDIERLGWRTYRVNHVEGGFPQMSVTFLNAGVPLPDNYVVSGSVDPTDLRARYRTPREVRWHRIAKFDHEFIGREAVEAELADPRRTTVTLRWNPEDVIDIYASLLQPGEEYTTLEVPASPDVAARAHADHVLKDGKHIGWSSGTTYSYFYREVISMGCIAIEAAKIGTEVILQWGDYGGRIKEVRATVGRFPYLAEERNDKIDVKALT